MNTARTTTAPAPDVAASVTTWLATLSVGKPGRISRLHGDAADRGWLAALGLAEGEDVVVLRRAPFGGPLHVRTESGGEFAVDRTLATRIEVVPRDEAPAA